LERLPDGLEELVEEGLSYAGLLLEVPDGVLSYLELE